MNDDDSTAQDIARKMMAAEGTSRCWNLQYEDGGVGWARVSFVVTADMLNGHQNAHGGMIFSLADSAFAYACNSRNHMSVAHNATVTFLSPGKLGERLTATADEVAREGRSGCYKVVVQGQDGRTVAVFQGLSRALRQPALEGSA